MKAIMDTCVILDYLQNREPFFDDALNIAIGRANREYEAYLTAASLTDLYYIIHRHTHSSIETHKIIDKLTQLFGVADSYAEDCINALHNGMSDYEDAVMMASAKRCQMDAIVARNTKHFSLCNTPVYEPDEFVSQFLNE